MSTNGRLSTSHSNGTSHSNDRSAVLGEPEPVAIIGIGCRFPGGAHDAESFWKLLSGGIDAISEVPPDRFNIERFYAERPSVPGKTVSRWGGFVQQRIELFDAAFFGMSPREAAYLDPMQRWLMEVSWEALEDAGMVPERVAGSDAAVFIGCFTEDIKLHQMAPHNRELIGPHAATGSAMTMVANRLSYLFDFRGPSVALDTACSSSLVAVHLACRSIWDGESSLALAGGANVIFRPEYTIAESKAGMLSADGRSKTFDARANGYVRGEGAGIVVLKPFERALADGDPIYALIRGSGVNQDGRTSSITVPNGLAQETLIQKVCARAAISPGTIQYVEAHGTGTPVGDPIEANALGKALSDGRAVDEPCWIGSLKTNIGHLEAAAGIAGLIKAALALKNRAIPPHLHLLRPNPAIDFQKLGLRVPSALEPWPRTSGPRRASVNSFGFGGTNAHVLLEAAPEQDGALIRAGTETTELELLTLSARSEPALLELARRYQEALSSPGRSKTSLSDICYSAATRRSHHDHRLALASASVERLAAELGALANGNRAQGTHLGRRREAPRVVFVFGGMGPQWWGMGRQLLEKEPVFEQFVRRCDALLQRHASWSLWREMTADEGSSRMRETRFAQPASFALQAGLAALFRSWGIVPDAVVGHSAGEVAAAYAAGVYDLEQATEIIYHRSRLQHRTTGLGKLVALGAPVEEVRPLVEQDGGISIAAINGPASLTLVGDREALERFVRPFQERSCFVRFLEVDVPYHSHYMDPLRDELSKVLAHVRGSDSELPLFSTVTGARTRGGAWNADYWWRNVRDSVLFAPAIEALCTEGYDTFLEIGAHPVLTASIQECFTAVGRSATVLSSLHRKSNDRAALLATLGELYVAGFPIDWHAFHGGTGSFVRLPFYPFQREPHWVESEASERDRVGPPPHPLLGERLVTSQPLWDNTIDLERLPYLADHVVRGSVVYPGAGYVEMMLSAARELFGNEGAPLQLSEIEFQKALFLESDRQAHVQVAFEAASGKLSVNRRNEARRQWVPHAHARLTPLPRAARRTLSLGELRALYPEGVSLSTCYRYLASLGLEYGPLFSGIRELYRDRTSALARVQLHDDLVPETAYALHPALLDACFQAMLVSTLPPEGTGEQQPRLYLPTHIASVRIYESVPKCLWVRTQLGDFDERSMRGDMVAYDEDGNVVLELSGVVARSLEHLEATSARDESRLFYGIEWQPRDVVLATSAPATSVEQTEPGTWLVLSDRTGFGEELVRELTTRGHRAIVAFTGERFRADETGERFELNPANPEHVQKLLQGAFARGRRSLRGILHLFSLDGAAAEDLTLEEVERAQMRGPIALLHLVQAQEPNQSNLPPPRIWAVTRGAQAVTDEQPVSAVVESTLWGMMRVVRYQEHPDRFGGVIDLDPHRRPEEVARFADDLCAGRLADELAYRDGALYLPRFVARPELASASPFVGLRADASYVITGGLGGLGLLVARWMVEHGARRLILLGRGALPPRAEWSRLPTDAPLADRVRAVRELEALGASVHLGAIDVADEEQLLLFLERYREEGWPPIRGVIHAAGVSRPHLMIELSKQAYLETARPKVRGAWLLHRHLGSEPLDFFVLFSSVAAFAFTAGQADYAAANAFLDALAHYRRARGLAAISINWGPWAEAGMATLLGDYFHKRGTIPFSPENGLSTLGSILERDPVQATVLWISDPSTFASNSFSSGTAVPLIERLLQHVDAGRTVDASLSAGDMVRGILEAPDAETQLERAIGYVRSLVGRVLRLADAQIDRGSRLNDLGLDSLLALELKNRIANEVRVTISVVELLKSPSIEALGREVLRALSDASRGMQRGTPSDGDGALVTGQVALAPNQHWFLARDLPNPNHWNMTTLWEAVRPLDPERLKRVLEAILLQHDMLRARFSRGDGAWRQTIAGPDAPIPLSYLDLSALSDAEQEAAIEARIAEFQANLDLREGPVVRVVYFARGARHRDWMLIAIHHLVADVFSLQIVLSDILVGYEQLLRGAPLALPRKTTSFKDWIEALVAHARSKENGAEVEYWRSIPWHAASPLPIDFSEGRALNTIASTRVFTASLSSEETSTLLRGLPRELGIQIMDALLAALGQAFARCMGLTSLLMDVIVHGRDNLSNDMDLSRTVGLFAHGIPLLLRLEKAEASVRFLHDVSDQLGRFLREGRTYAALRWLSEDQEVMGFLRSLPRREVIFNYVGQFEPPDSEAALIRAVPRVPPALEDPENMRDFLIQCQVGILNGRMTALWSYSTNVHRTESIERLSAHFFEVLRAFAGEIEASKFSEIPERARAVPSSRPAVSLDGGE